MTKNSKKTIGIKKTELQSKDLEMRNRSRGEEIGHLKIQRKIEIEEEEGLEDKREKDGKTEKMMMTEGAVAGGKMKGKTGVMK